MKSPRHPPSPDKGYTHLLRVIVPQVTFVFQFLCSLFFHWLNHACPPPPTTVRVTYPHPYPRFCLYFIVLYSFSCGWTMTDFLPGVRVTLPSSDFSLYFSLFSFLSWVGVPILLYDLHTVIDHLNSGG